METVELEFTRDCPKCDITLQYSSKYHLQRAIQNKSVCNFCAMTDEIRRKISKALEGKKLSEEAKQKMKGRVPWNKGKKGLQKASSTSFKKGSIPWNKGKTNVYSEETKRKISKTLSGRKLSEERRRKISESLKGEKHPMYGKFHSKESKRKMRLSRIEELEQKHGQLIPNYNPNACKLIEEYGKKHGYNFQHAENGGEFHIKELGYWIDGYDAEQNVVIEVDELHHKYQIEKDQRRQKEIEEHLGCQFIVLEI